MISQLLFGDYFTILEKEKEIIKEEEKLEKEREKIEKQVTADLKELGFKV